MNTYNTWCNYLQKFKNSFSLLWLDVYVPKMPLLLRPSNISLHIFPLFVFFQCSVASVIISDHVLIDRIYKHHLH